MATFTSNLNLKKPDGGDFYNIADHNGNMDIIDSAIAGKADSTATTNALNALNSVKASASALTALSSVVAGKTKCIFSSYTGSGYQAVEDNPMSITAPEGFTIDAIYFCTNSENNYYKLSNDNNDHGIPHIVTKTMTDAIDTGRNPKFSFNANVVSWYLTSPYSGSNEAITNGAIGMSNNTAGTVYHYILIGREV